MTEEEMSGEKTTEKEKPEIKGLDNSVMLRLPEVLVVMSGDSKSGEKSYPGNVGFKYGPSKEDWVRIPYISMKKIIDFCSENKVLFNSQLSKEREKNLVSDL